MSRLIFESCFIKKINLKRIYRAKFKLSKRNTSVINSDRHSKCPFGTLSVCKFCARSNKHSSASLTHIPKPMKIMYRPYSLFIPFYNVPRAADADRFISTQSLLRKDAGAIMSRLHRFVVRKILKP